MLYPLRVNEDQGKGIIHSRHQEARCWHGKTPSLHLCVSSPRAYPYARKRSTPTGASPYNQGGRVSVKGTE